MASMRRKPDKAFYEKGYLWQRRRRHPIRSIKIWWHYRNTPSPPSYLDD